MSEYVCETTDDYPDVPWGDDDYSGTVERRERGGRMSEHIFQTDEIDGVFSVFVAPNIVVSDMIGQREEVVRCRDCGRAYRRGGGVYCSRVLQWGSNDRPAPLPVDPEGFCAWGERREES